MSADGPPANGVYGLVTTRPVGVAMAFLSLLIFGWVSLQRLPLNLLPDIAYPRVTVRAEYPGAAPEDVEERVTKRLHEALSVLGRLESISSISRAELADVTLEFTWGTELTYAIQDIRERLDRAMLPLEVGTPIILRYDPTLDPILVLGLTGGRDLVELRRLAEDRLAPALSTIEGVAAVRVRGGLEDEIQIRLLPERMASFGLRPADITARLAAENVNMASGTVLEGDTEYLVRILNEYVTPAEIARTPLFRDGDSVVRLSDVADVRRTTKDRDVITRVSGAESVELQVFKEADANIVELAARVVTRTFGSASQRRWVDALRAGSIPDPDAAFDAFHARAAADPALAASLERVEKAAMSMGGMGPGGGMPPGGGMGAPPPEDTRTEAEKILDASTSAELSGLRKGLADRDAAFAYLAADLPADVTVHLLSDQSRFIQSALDEVREAGIMGAWLAVLVLMLFLGKLGPTVIISVAIPVSVLVTFAPLHLSSTSLNVMSLGGLALGIGMVVDNAIVVLESIARMRDLGKGRIEAAVDGVREVSGAAIASTLTTVAVFAPIVFVEGIAGQVFRDQALTVVASLSVSLFVALFLVPMLASRDTVGVAPASLASGGWGHVRAPLASVSSLRGNLGARRGVGRVLRLALLLPLFALQLALEGLARLLVLVLTLFMLAVVLVGFVLVGVIRLLMFVPMRVFALVYGAVERIYAPIIGAVVRSPTAIGLVLLASAGLLAWTWHTVGRLGSELLPEVHQGEIIARLAMPVGTPLQTTDVLARTAEERLHADPRVRWVSSTVGVPRDEISQPDEGEHSVRLAIGLHPSTTMAETEEAVMADLRAALAEVPALRDMRFERPTLFSVRSPIVVEIQGDDLRALAAAAARVEAALVAIPGLRDVRSSVQPGNPEVMLTFDRDLLSRYDLDSRRLADTVSDMVKGSVATRFTDEEHKLDVLVQVDKLRLQSIDDLLGLPVNPRAAASEPLAALARTQVREGPREIRRIWGQRAAVVSASLAGFDVGRASDEIRERIQDIERQTDLTITLGGQSSEMTGALDQMLQALLLAVFLVYVVMASIFESLVQPLIILVTIPLALVGAVAALALLDMPLSVVVFIGAIILAGIVVNNAIVLIDAINRRRRIDGMALHEAVRVACALRLRPILMTTLTTVLGLLPLTGLLPGGGGEGTELRAPMAVTVVAGLSCATLLTLVVIPTVYVVVESLLASLATRGSRASDGSGGAALTRAPGEP